MKCSPPFNDKRFSPEAKDLIQRLLTKDPSRRLGSQSAEEVKRHAFFKVYFPSPILTIPPGTISTSLFLLFYVLHPLSLTIFNQGCIFFPDECKTGIFFQDKQGRGKLLGF